jgi:hypothetical protein
MSDTPISPSVGSLTLGGVAPAVINAAVAAITPSVGSLALSGVAPTAALTAVQTNTRDGNGLTVVWQLNDGAFAAGNPFTLTGFWNSAFFQVTGTFGSGGSIQLEGSDDGVNFYKLSPAALTSAGFFAALGVNERHKFIRPHVTAGDTTTALTVTAFLASS